jgi:uncharacterized membrane protein YuzA (DUF378 family)
MFKKTFLFFPPIHPTLQYERFLTCSQHILNYSQTGVRANANSEGGIVMKTIDVIAAVLVIVGALNWGLVGLANLDLVAALFGMRFGETSALTSAVYALVGLAGIYQGLFWKAIGRRWHVQPDPARAR